MEFLDFKKEFWYCDNPLIPEGWLGIDDGQHLHLFLQGGHISINKSLVDINDYLNKMKTNSENNENSSNF